MINRNSTLREVYRNPVGKDILDRVLHHIGRSPRVIENPVVGGMTLHRLDKLIGTKAPGVVDMLITQLSYHQEKAPPSPPTITRKWWKEAVVYQIYPRSFYDSDGDGIGDLKGIKEKIPYLKALGVDVVWLSPIYDSPNDDNGYDIRNYRKIMKEFGNLNDFRSMVSELHKNGIKLMMDLVLNHTSDEHEWFQKALADPDAPEKDFYIWAKGRGEGVPPNNWKSFFSGPAWNHYPESDDWALHLFSKKQMDLNWDNPDLRAEIYDMVNWWIGKGVDGFRLDVINLISKDSLADGNPLVGKAFGFQGIEHYMFGPRLHEFLQEMNAECFSKADIFTVGECPGTGLEMSRLLTAEERHELDLVFNFDHLDNPGESRQVPYQYDARHFKRNFVEWQTGYGNNCWPTIFFDNHDNPRMVSKINPDVAWRPVIAKMLAVLLFTQKGTPFLYQGQELGMTNCRFDFITELKDVESQNRYLELCAKLPPDAAFAQVAWGCRDHARTPMQWNAEENAGFTTGEPWMKVNPNYPAINAENEMARADSVYTFHRDMIALRKAHKALVYGEFKPVFLRDKNTLCFFRILEGEKFYIEVNLTDEAQKRPGPLTSSHVLLAGNYGGTTGQLRPYEANVYKI